MYYFLIQINKVHHITYNIFLSKVENAFNIDDVVDIEIVLKGVKRGKSDSSRYYLRITFKDKVKIIFGQTTSFSNIKFKVLTKFINQYQKTMAFLKGIILPHVDKKFVKDEVSYIELHQFINYFTLIVNF